MLSTMRAKHLYRRAFTLVELLVVIGMIALLISILMPSLSKARKAAASTKCLAFVRPVGTALTIYMNDHKNRGIPYYSSTDELSLWMGQIRHVYSKVDESRLCPEATENSNLPSFWGAVNMAWGPGTSGFLKDQKGSYCINGWLYYSNQQGLISPSIPGSDPRTI